MTAEKSQLDLEFTLTTNPAAYLRNVMTSAPRAVAVIAMQDPDVEPTDAAPIPPLEVIAPAGNAEDLRDLAELFTILAGATAQAADQLEAEDAQGGDETGREG